MVDDTPIIEGAKGRLLPDRRRQHDFFTCDIFDAIPKSDIASMEHPIFSITTRPDIEERTYQKGDVTLTVSPHPHFGLPTVHDKDILIFAISQLIAAINRGQKVSRRISASSYDILTSTNRNTGGKDYESLRKSLQRLASTRINTTIRSGGRIYEREFSLIDDWGTVREDTRGRLLEMEIALNDWVFAAIENNEVLTIHPDYFRLRSPLDRRLYELARKHCGRQDRWEISLEKLRDKVGARSELKVFRHAIRKSVAASAHIPDYDLLLDADRDVVVATRRLNDAQRVTAPMIAPLSADAIAEAKRRAPGWDVYRIEADWRAWIAADPSRIPRDPAASFISFSSTWAARR